jgi:hypothetical protein
MNRIGSAAHSADGHGPELFLGPGSCTVTSRLVARQYQCLAVIRANGASVSNHYPLDGNGALRHTVCAFSIALKESFNSDGAVVTYLNARTGDRPLCKS